MKKIILKYILFFGVPITYLASCWLKFVKERVKSGKIEDNIFMKVGILPVLDHYYQPLINPKKHLAKSLRDDRKLFGIDFNIEEQLSLLDKFDYNDELLRFPVTKMDGNGFFYNNEFYESGDAEFLYNIIRQFKPKKIIEIGSGYSTLMVRNAIIKNKLENSNYSCSQICIEPYERSWLEELDIQLIRVKVETIDTSFFSQLEANDILFIDSTHIIRPQGDVLFEYLELLPNLKPGVLIHVHDIFSPKDYPDEWIYENHWLWNEQYLLEALLTFNSEFKIIGALNFLTHHYPKEFLSKCPVYANQHRYEPGAFWMIKN